MPATGLGRAVTVRGADRTGHGRSRVSAAESLLPDPFNGTPPTVGVDDDEEFIGNQSWTSRIAGSWRHSALATVRSTGAGGWLRRQRRESPVNRSRIWGALRKDRPGAARSSEYPRPTHPREPEASGHDTHLRCPPRVLRRFGTGNRFTRSHPGIRQRERCADGTRRRAERSAVSGDTGSLARHRGFERSNWRGRRRRRLGRRPRVHVRHATRRAARFAAPQEQRRCGRSSRSLGAPPQRTRIRAVASAGTGRRCR